MAGATMSEVALGTLNVQDRFNAQSDAARIPTVLSPTCPDCLAGMRLVGTAASDARATRIRHLALWTAMRPGDCESAAVGASAALRSASGFSHFWEEDGWPISTARRPLLDPGRYEPTRSAWDVYLFYEPGVTWDGYAPPTPTEWAHHFQAEPGVGDPLALATIGRWLEGRP